MKSKESRPYLGFLKEYAFKKKLLPSYILTIATIVLTAGVSLVRPELQGKVIDDLGNPHSTSLSAFMLLLVVFLGMLLLNYLISGILIFMGLLNYFSTTSTNIIIRQREFSIMRSIGMTQGMLRKMLIYEGIIYVGGVLGLLLIIGSIIMGIVVYILKQNIEYFVFQYPFEGLLCIICIMSFLCVIIPNIFLHKMERNSLIERIKKER